MVVGQAQKPGPTWGEFGGDEAWGEKHTEVSSRAGRQESAQQLRASQRATAYTAKERL